MEPIRAPIFAGQPAALRELGYDEIWLQNWLARAPSRLGLGEVNILQQEQTQQRGSLDILAADGDTYYSIEVQLGEVDASHSFRVFDYWARNRARVPSKTHVAVLIAENASGRFRPALAALAEFVPLIVIELRAWRGEQEAIIIPETLIANESLDLPGTAGPAGGEARTRSDWHEACSEEAWRFHEDFLEWTKAELGDVRPDYSPKSYIGVRRGRRVWAPMWPVRNGATVHLPDPDGSREESPSVAFEHFRERLEADGLSPSWQPSYNAGANPITLRLKRSDLRLDPVQDLLRASIEILNDGMAPWSERHPLGTGENGLRAEAENDGTPHTSADRRDLISPS